ncbi:MAG: chaperone modulator CbpM [Gammaproteobacteria bacterium]
MSDRHTTILRGLVVEEEVQLTLTELCQACRSEEQFVRAWIAEGILEPVGASPPEWRFTGESLRRARLARRLARDLGINPAGVALALDLLEEIQALRARIGREGSG